MLHNMFHVYLLKHTATFSRVVKGTVPGPEKSGSSSVRTYAPVVLVRDPKSIR